MALPRLAADENFNGRIVRGVQRRLPEVDLIRVQDTTLSGADDAVCSGLGGTRESCRADTTRPRWWSKHGSEFSRDDPCRGWWRRSFAPIGEAVADLVLLTVAGKIGDVENRVLYVPF